MKNLVSKFIKYLLNLFFFIIDLIVPTKKNLIGFGSYAGRNLSGNTRALFSYFIEQKTYDCFFLAKKEVFDELKNEYGYRIIHIKSLKAVFMLLRSNWFISSHGPGDYLNYPIEKSTKVFQTWHGKPYKNDFLAVKKLSKGMEKKISATFSKYSAMTSTSAFCRYYLSAATRMDINKILPYGYPRDDILIKHKNKASEQSLELLFQVGKYNFLYAPTYRDNKNIIWFPFTDANLERFNEWLIENEVNLFLRAHINDIRNLDIYKYSNINHFGFLDFPDINQYLFSFCGLVTDYSSIYLDYLLLDKPVIFLDYDFDEFNNSRGLSLPRDIIAIGDHPKTQKDFIFSLEKAINDPEQQSKERNTISLLFNEWSNGNSCKNISEYINKNL